MKPSEFVKKYSKDAKLSQDNKGIPSRFTLAQAAIESGWGEHAPGFNFFGVKAAADTPMEKRQLLRTREVLKSPHAKFPEVISIANRPDGRYEYIVRDWFRKYDSPEESFSDHADFFYTNKRYAKALEVKDDPYKFAQEVAKAGYATDPNYAKVLKDVIKMIEKYYEE